jgi:phospholipid/cholesterol/gamma-HCH transport system substrate-binding protein
MEKSTASTIRLGLFVTIGAIIFTAAVYMIGQKQSMFSETFTIRAFFNNVNGLQTGNNVRFSGINIGSVTAVTFLNDSLIEVKMRIRESVRMYIKKNSVASIGTDGLMGNMLVNIVPGKGESEPVINDQLITSFTRIRTDDILNTLNITNENAAKLTQNLVEMTDQILHGKGTVTSLLYNTELAEEITLTAHNLRVASEKTIAIAREVNTITLEINQGRGTLGWLLKDTTAEHKIENTLQSLELTAKHLQAVSDSLSVLLTQIKDGDGTISVLINDSIAARDLKETIHNLNQGTTSLQENMDALKYSWPFKKGFKRQEKEKKK